MTSYRSLFASCAERERMACRWRSLTLGAALALIFLAGGEAWAAEERKENQSAFSTADNQVISSSALIKLLNRTLDNRHQDLEVLIGVCGAGEFATRAKAAGGLQGNWSVTTSAARDKLCNVGRTPDAEDIPQKGQDGSTVAGLKIGERFYHGFEAQYVKKLLADKNTVGNKALFTFGRDKNHVNTNPQYQSSGELADNMTVHGGKKSNHALFFSSTGDERLETLTDSLYDALKATGYNDGDIELLRGTGAPAGKVDARATKAELELALGRLGVKLNENPGEEKAFIYVEAHGNYQQRTVAYRDGQLDQGGGGVILSNALSTVEVFADEPFLLSGLMEELPKAGGGFWADDPVLQRGGQPYLTLTTYLESFAADADVEVLLNGLPVGILRMARNATDYQIDLSDTLLDQIMPALLSEGILHLGFRFASDGDMIQLAGLQDYLDPNFAPLDYGIGIGSLVRGFQTLAAPEPGSLALILIALLAVLLSARARRLGWGHPSGG